MTRLAIPVGAQLDIPIPNLSAVLSVYDQIEVYKAAAKTGPFAEVTTIATRIKLVPGKSLYRFIDSDGAPTDWYRARLSNSSDPTNIFSGYSDAVQGTVDRALEFLSAEELRTNYLFGLDLTDDAGNPMPDSLLEHYIKAAFSYLEIYLDMPLRPTAIDENHDFMWRDWQKWGEMRANKRPIISIEKLTVELPGARAATEIPASWIKARGGRSRLIHIIPTGGFQELFAYGGTWWAIPLANIDFVPSAIRLEYTAGFTAETLPEVIRDIAGKLAAHGPLNIAGDLIVGAGIASKSISMDGLSQSVNTTSSATNSGYGARLVQYNKEVKEALPDVHAAYNGPELMVG